MESFELEETLKGQLFQLPCNEQGHLQLDQSAQSPAPVYFQGRDLTPLWEAVPLPHRSFWERIAPDIQWNLKSPAAPWQGGLKEPPSSAHMLAHLCFDFQILSPTGEERLKFSSEASLGDFIALLKTDWCKPLSTHTASIWMQNIMQIR